MNIDRGQHAEAHSEWKELCALSITGALEPSEEALLREHLATCADCLLVCRQYETLAVEGMPFLASLAESAVTADTASGRWDPALGQRQLFDKLDQASAPAWPRLPKRVEAHSEQLWRWAVAAMLIVGVGFGSYHLGRHSIVVPATASQKLDKTAQLQQATQQKAALEQRIASEIQRATEAEKALADGGQRTADLEIALHDLDVRSKNEEATLSANATQLQALRTERDNLAASLRDARQSATDTQKDLVSLHQQRDQDSLHYASLEVEVSDLTGRLHEAETRDRNDTQFLASDRDIRELMGARQLYIADVTDVDQNGEKRKPFGRVFYTKGKSLIFYAFDLDQQKSVKDVSNTTFQAWAGSDTAKPVSLGVFYVDSEANRRWVLKTEDTKTLAQINSVFVTVEPKGGSQNPSGKKLLSAYLRSASPNHP